MDINCAKCRKLLRNSIEIAGQLFSCPKCGHSQRMPLLPKPQPFGSVSIPVKAPRRKPTRLASSKKKEPGERESPPTTTSPIADLSDGARQNACPECQHLIPNSVWYSADLCPYCHEPLDDGESSDENETEGDEVVFDNYDELSPGYQRHLINERKKKKTAKSLEAKRVGQWMADQFNRKGKIYQREIVDQIEELFGSDFIYLNQNGNPAIRQIVLDEFHKLTNQTAVWVKSMYSWRTRRPGDDPAKRFVE